MSAADRPRIAYLVSHTHWDREWYEPFSVFRTMLARVVDGVLDALEKDDAYRHFCLDGQSVVLEDYLEVRPEARDRVARLAASGALALGPWYVLPDEFLIPPEATVRNLLLGHRVAAAFAPAQRVGYVPDAFGHIAQLPQILARAGIDAFVYTRGDGDAIDETGLEWTWEAPDGSQVLALQQWGGYCNAASLGHEEIWHAHTAREIGLGLAVDKVRALFQGMGERSNGDIWLLNNGCDHFPVQRDFARVLAALRQAFPDVEFRHASFGEFARAVSDAGVARTVRRGDLRGGRHHHVLSGVWSARMPLKQRNDLAHALLADVAEPLAAFVHARRGRTYPHGLLEHAWKTLLKNQPHDSICGCSTDEVHREMEPRFDAVVQTAEALVRETLQSIVPTFGRRPTGDRDTALAVFHPLPEARDALLERLVVLQPLDYDIDALRVLDDAGRAVPFEIVARHRVQRFWGVDWRRVLDAETQRSRFATYAAEMGSRFLEPAEDDGLVDTFLDVRILAPLPPVGVARLRLVEDAGRPVPVLPDAERVRIEGDTLTNGLVTVRLHPDGRLDLTDERTGRRTAGLNVLEDVEDVGDEYDYSPAAEGETVTSRDARGTVRVRSRGDLAGALETAFSLSLPERIAEGRTRRSGTRVACPVRITVRLEARSPVVDVDVHFENRARDHRLAVHFASRVHADTVVSDAHFLLDERSVDAPSGASWVQPPPDTLPQQEFTLVHGAGGGLAVLVRGLPEVAALRRADGSVDLRLTLLRSVGWLSRDDFPTRRCQNAGPTVPTPEAQCLGPQRFRYALLPLGPGDDALYAKRWSRRWRAPLACVQGVVDGSAAPGPGLVEALSGQTALSAVKRAEDRDTLVVRLHNLARVPVEETLRFGLDLRAAWQTDLLEAREVERVVEAKREIRLRLQPHEIATVEVEPA